LTIFRNAHVVAGWERPAYSTDWAMDAKAEIQARLRRGEDESTILKYFRSQYGEQVLIKIGGRNKDGDELRVPIGEVEETVNSQIASFLKENIE